ncbi:MAG: transcriptional repressor [Gemmatimonadota bacterium]
MTRRRTQQRKAIRSAFTQAGRPLSPEEVLELARAHVPSLGQATVYRNVGRLVEEGWLTEVSLPGESTRYEAASLPHHHHFLCRGCGRAFDIPACPGEMEELAPRGFVAESHEVVLYGRCPGCQ